MSGEEGRLRIGTCSWNYDSWVGLVYTAKSRRSAGYLPEYARRFDTAEIDSWFYKLPERSEALEYLSVVPEDFHFTCKVTERISLTHERRRGGGALVPNPDFLSEELFADYVGRIEVLLPRLDAVMLEFEYLNRDKMPSLDAFLRSLEALAPAVPPGLPLAIETRNKNYLRREYFQFLRDRGWSPVFSEKLYMPPIYEVYAEFGDLIGGNIVLRLLGGDRAEIETRTGGSWDSIVEPKDDKIKIAEMSRDILYRGGKVTININNHYEGSAPLTAAFFERELRGQGREKGGGMKG